MKRSGFWSGSWVVMALFGALQGCGGGGGSASGTAPEPAPTFSVLTATEVNAVKDPSSTYSVEEDRVIDATVVTTDGLYTFADVNADIDDTDAIVPEVSAHLVIADAGYPDDGLTTNVSMRLRGSSTRLADQKSYRVKLAKNMALWRRETTLQLNKHPYDLSRFRNKLAFDLFREIPHIASLRTQFVHMAVTNKDASGLVYASSDFGLFTHVEKMGKEYLTNRGLPTTGNIYKAESFDFNSGVGSTAETLASALDAAGKVIDKAKFETVLSLEADNSDHRPLIAMINDVNDESISFDITFDKYFDKANYLTWLASNILFGNRDTINQNFGLYQPAGGSKFYFVPWDYDGAFGFEDQPDQRAEGALYADWQKTVANWWGIPLHRRFLNDPQHLAELKLAVREIYSAYLTDAKIQAKVAHYKGLVAPFIAATPDSAHLPLLPGSTESASLQWAAEADRISSAVKANHDAFLAGLESPMPFWQAASLVSSNAQLQLAWDAALDLQGQAVTYTVQLATDPNFSAGTLVLPTPRETSATSLEISTPADGIYYLKVTAKDVDNHTQNAFDRFDVGATHYFGVSAYRLVTNAGVRVLEPYFGP